ncbi:hypothetical protein [Methylocystis echinoides]|uniref:Uncharacterized protein n=1 Tax=Methylocystis echinoides TaxID=29468 RepID=A0A9W6LU43_9HYPH|nr:hypothetical protein [Methylocystis echinoides]RTL81591.1 MAG: hypothetical protein EKK29_17390 [Hyphomicrobiales bacterium]GLI95166.1 hypothetical protein LMG27198_41580 [Methylocystis echinoides]
MRTILIAAGVIAATVGTAAADCNAEIEKTKSDWAALKLEPGSKPSSMEKGIGGHEHITAAVTSMRVHLHEAIDLCKAGNEHEALLHVNVIRAFLDLPEFQHPKSHLYLYNGGKKQ